MCYLEGQQGPQLPWEYALPWDGPVTGPGARAGSLESHVERLSLGEWLTGE